MTPAENNENPSRQDEPRDAQPTRSRGYLADLVQCMRPLLKSVAREHAQSVPDCKEDESDIVQRSVVKAIEHLDQFDGQTTGQWRAWLVSIVRNQAKDVRRYWSQERRNHSHEERDSHLIISLEDHKHTTPSKAMVEMENRQQLDAALASLTAQEQQLVRWRRYKSMSYREIAGLLNITEPTARRRCDAALDSLREAMTRMGA